MTGKARGKEEEEEWQVIGINILKCKNKEHKYSLLGKTKKNSAQ